MKAPTFWLGVALMGIASHTFAQYDTDALRYSQTQFGGSARTLGIGGANVAVGADLGNLSSNPAGLGLYQRSEFILSPGFGNSTTRSQAYGNTTTDLRSSLHIASLGMAFTGRRPDSDTNDWRGGTLALSFTRTADFNRSFRFKGTPGVTRDLLAYLDRNSTQRTSLDELAYETFLTDKDTAGYYVPVDYSKTAPLTQDQTVLTTGSQTQFDIGYGTSYRNKLYLGASIGIVGNHFNMTRTLTAVDPTPADPATAGTAFSSATFRETLKTQGGGINLRVGAIYQPLDYIRLGASIQTPTILGLSEEYNASMSTTFDKAISADGKTYNGADYALDPSEFDYTLSTPFRANGGVAFILGKYGFLSADAEWLNYGNARLSNTSSSESSNPDPPFDFSADNDAIRANYGQALNLRAGGELRLAIFRVRAGYARYEDPYTLGHGDRTTTYLTGGLGIRQKNFFFDIAGVRSNSRLYYSPYVFTAPNGSVDTNLTSVASVRDTRFNTTFTLGFLL